MFSTVDGIVSNYFGPLAWVVFAVLMFLLVLEVMLP
jgi:hypothetical protein